MKRQSTTAPRPENLLCFTTPAQPVSPGLAHAKHRAKTRRRLPLRAAGCSAATPGCGPSAARQYRYLQLLLEVESRQPTAGLLGGHGLGNLHPHLAKPAPAVEAVRRSLNLGGAYEHLAEAEGACLMFCAFEHALGNICAAELPVEIHPA